MKIRMRHNHQVVEDLPREGHTVRLDGTLHYARKGHVDGVLELFSHDDWEPAPQSWVHLVGDCIADGRCLRYPGVGPQVYLILPEGFRWRKLRIDEINPFQYEKYVLVLERERPS